MYGIKNIIVFGVLTFFVSPGTLYSMGDFNFDSMENLQQELEEANRAIEEYISSLPAEEQAEFNRQVDEVTQMFENMSEDEFASFLNEMFAEEPMMPLPTEPSMSQPVFAPETPALTSEQKKKVDNVITVINDIIRQSNIFLVQISSSLEASKNIDSWSKKGAIMYWQPNTDWQNLKFDIEKFVQQLYKLEDKDLTTQEYKYILDLIADEATLNNLIQLQTNLNASIPQIEISEMDIKALSAQSKEVIKNSLQYYTEALYVLNLPKAIDTIIEKYSSKAEKSREAEEAAEKELPKLQNVLAHLLEHQLPALNKKADMDMTQAMVMADTIMVHTAVVTDLITMAAAMETLVVVLMAVKKAAAKRDAEKAALLAAVAVAWAAVVELRELKVKKDKKNPLNQQLAVQ